jgi:hypothetical protein
MRALGFLFLLVLVGCQADRSQWEARYDAILVETDSAADAVPLPRVPGLPPADSVTGPRGRARFLAQGHELVLDASHTRPRAFPTSASGIAPQDVLPALPRTIGTLEAPFDLEPSALDPAVVDGAELLVDRALDAVTVLRAIDAIARTYRLTHAVLRVDSDGHGASVELALGSYVRIGDPPARSGQELALEAYVLPGGVELSAAGGTLVPGCRLAGAAGTLTVPDRDAELDGEAITACLEHVLAELPDETQIFVAAAEGVSVERLAAVMVALHGEPPRGLQELLPIAARLDRGGPGSLPADEGGLHLPDAEVERVDALLRGAFGDDVPEGLLVPGS